MMINLPTEILIEVFRYLKGDFLTLRISIPCVCRYFRSIVEDILLTSADDFRGKNFESWKKVQWGGCRAARRGEIHPCITHLQARGIPASGLDDYGFRFDSGEFISIKDTLVAAENLTDPPCHILEGFGSKRFYEIDGHWIINNMESGLPVSVMQLVARMVKDGRFSSAVLDMFETRIVKPDWLREWSGPSPDLRLVSKANALAFSKTGYRGVTLEEPATTVHVDIYLTAIWPRTSDLVGPAPQPGYFDGLSWSALMEDFRRLRVHLGKKIS